jgi:hypothetical protein
MFIISAKEDPLIDVRDQFRIPDAGSMPASAMTQGNRKNTDKH